MALLHELAHVRRWDNLVNLLQRVVEAVLFFHPAVWIVSGWVRREREHCCDRIVVDHTGRARDYADALFALADAPAAPHAHGAFMTRNHLVDRIRRILNPEEPAMRLSRSVVALAASTIAVPAILFAAYVQKSPSQGPTPKVDRLHGNANADAGPWPPDRIHSWVVAEFQREPDVAALIRDVVATYGDLYEAQAATRNNDAPAVKAVERRRSELMAQYDALWDARHDAIRRRAPAEVKAEALNPLDLEVRVESLFRSAPDVSDVALAVIQVDQDLSRPAKEGRDRHDPSVKKLEEFRAELTASSNALWNERQPELRRRVLANLRDGAPDDLESKITNELRRDPVLGPMIWELEVVDRQVFEAMRTSREPLDPALKKRQDELRAKFKTAWNERYDAIRRRILIGTDEFAEWRLDVSNIFRRDPAVAALEDETSATDLEIQRLTSKNKNDPALKELERRKDELMVKHSSLWNQRYGAIYKQAVAELQNKFAPQRPEAKNAAEGDEQASKLRKPFTKMAFMSGSPDPYYFTPIPETLATHVSGTARDEKGEPIAKADVTLYAVTNDGAKPAATTSTDAEGRYEFRGVRLPVSTSRKIGPNYQSPPHIWFLVSGQSPGKGVAWNRRWSMWEYNPQNLDENDEGHLLLRSDVSLDLKFGKAAALHGKIVDKQGKPISGASVRVVDHGVVDADGRESNYYPRFEWAALPDAVGRAQSGTDGGFRIEGLTERACYTLVVTRPESPRTEFSLWATTVSGPDQNHKPNFDGHIFRGEHQARTSPATITVPRLRPVELSLVGDDDGKPIAGAQIALRDFASQMSVGASGESDASGKIHLGLPPSDQCYISSTPPPGSRYLPTHGTSAVVKPGEGPMTIEIRHKPGAELILEAVEAGTGKPVPDVFFWWTVEGQFDQTSRSAQDVSVVLQNVWTNEKGELHTAVAPAPGRRYRFHFGGMREPITTTFDPGSARTYGYEASPAQSEPVELVPGKPIRLRFELKKGPPDPNPFRPRPR
jgi:protocatechuate 3,4-dioxygenase beta subunit